MNEIEVKVLNIDKYDIQNKLEKLGAQLVKDEEQINIRFDTKDNYLKSTKNGYLRIRITKNNLTNEVVNTLTLKKNISKKQVRVNEEIETIISNVDETIKILENMNYIMKKPGEKHRRSYKYNEILFEIDEWDKSIYKYPYLEIEVKDKKQLDDAIELLSLNKDNITSKSIGDLLKDE